MEQIHRILEALECLSAPSVLATIIRVEGSAYRKEGACALLQEDGTQIGILSPGCLEADLAGRARHVWEQGGSQTVVFDLEAEDDLSWGQGAGCNGKIYVLLEPVGRELKEHMRTLQHFLDRKMSVAIVKKLASDFTLSDYVFVAEDGQTFGPWRKDIPAPLIGMHSHKAAPEPRSGVTFMPEISANVYIHRFYPKPRLIIFGAGPDARPLAELAAVSGFAVMVSDWRPASLSKEHFPRADALYLGFPDTVLNELKPTSFDSVIVMTHHFKRDQALLRELLKRSLRYVGVLGPRRRTARLLEGEAIPSWVRSPIGLNIAAEGPEEIAVSVVAELIQVHRRRFGETAVMI